ncbi:PPE family protein [Mycobacterium bohemicum DSM 44277]|uniref:PPE family protein n=2 Tax=Mycobacterium bohemicum TaxID=56425 RepID=A0A1X1R8T3_MYCBE|nr:PPE family protein [Mycobacterium bohemicum]MCV6970792.1 PPE family protein [Mycobacterium bohemicum]ORV01382.1 hypothetical protein AWB93_07265 [Mycobacterium bohemicum]CPR08948.1 PPE family protein [Mycobacterium bohemicum DSM 44277]
MDFGLLPPEINSARMYAGPGSGSMVAAAVTWDNLATELMQTASSYRSVIASLTTGRWLGASSLTMASAFGPYVAWAMGAAARAAEAASHARLAVEGFEAAFAMTVPPAAVAANRVQLATLVATNFFGQNSAAIAATEAEYCEMWAQDAAAMYQYAAHSAAATDVTQFTSPPEVVNVSGLGQQASTVAQAAASATSQFSLQTLMSAVPTALQNLTIPGIGSTTTATTLFASNAPAWLMAAATPMYAMSSVFGIAASSQGMLSSAAAGAASAGAAAAQAAAGLGAAASGAAALPGVLGSIGTASALGPLSVPASWTSVIPATTVSSVTPLANVGSSGTNIPPILGSLPRSGGTTRNLGPRYGMVPTIMTRPPSGGYG